MHSVQLLLELHARLYFGLVLAGYELHLPSKLHFLGFRIFALIVFLFDLGHLLFELISQCHVGILLLSKLALVLVLLPLAVLFLRIDQRLDAHLVVGLIGDLEKDREHAPYGRDETVLCLVTVS